MLTTSLLIKSLGSARLTKVAPGGGGPGTLDTDLLQNKIDEVHSLILSVAGIPELPVAFDDFSRTQAAWLVYHFVLEMKGDAAGGKQTDKRTKQAMAWFKSPDFKRNHQPTVVIQKYDSPMLTGKLNEII